MHKFEAEEKQLYRDQVSDVAIESNVKSISVPPKPILLARSHKFMLFKPAKFKPANKQRVISLICAWWLLESSIGSGLFYLIKLLHWSTWLAAISMKLLVFTAKTCILSPRVGRHIFCWHHAVGRRLVVGFCGQSASCMYTNLLSGNLPCRICTLLNRFCIDQVAFHACLHKLEVLEVMQFNSVIEIYPRPTIVAVVTKIWKF